MAKRIISREYLVDGKEYIATDIEGRQYKGVFVYDYMPGGVFYCVFPAFLSDGKTENNLVSFEEI